MSITTLLRRKGKTSSIISASNIKKKGIISISVLQIQKGVKKPVSILPISTLVTTTREEVVKIIEIVEPIETVEASKNGKDSEGDEYLGNFIRVLCI